MFTLAICPILNGYTQVVSKILLIQTNHTTCVSFSCQFIYWSRYFMSFFFLFLCWLYVSGSGSITSIGEEGSNLSAIVYL